MALVEDLLLQRGESGNPLLVTFGQLLVTFIQLMLDSADQLFNLLSLPIKVFLNPLLFHAEHGLVLTRDSLGALHKRRVNELFEIAVLGSFEQLPQDEN